MNFFHCELGDFSHDEVFAKGAGEREDGKGLKNWQRGGERGGVAGRPKELAYSLLCWRPRRGVGLPLGEIMKMNLEKNRAQV